MLERILRLPRSARAGAVPPLPSGFKPWILLSLGILVGSLMLLAVGVVAAFISFGQPKTPLWLVFLFVIAGLGVAAGFGGFFLLLSVAGFQEWRKQRRASAAAQ